MSKLLKVLLLLVGLAALITMHGYWYSTTVLQKYIDSCGAYPTLDEAIDANFRHNGYDPSWFDVHKSQNSKNVPYTWYVIDRVKREYQSAVDAVKLPPTVCGGSFYEHTRQGWVGMPEHMLNAFGYLDLWMKVFHLYGE